MFAQPLRVQAQRRARVRAQPRALRLPALGPGGVRQLRGGAAQHRHLPPGEPRVPRPRRRVARRPGVPRHARRDRLAHDDDQRPRRARLGRGRHRGRGGDARPAGLDADPAGGGLQAHRRAARGLDRHRPRPDRHPDAARERRGRQVRRVLRPGPRATCRSPTAPRSGTCRRRWARPARSSRSTRRRSATSSSPAGPSERVALVEAYCKEQGLFHDESSEEATYSDTLELDLGDVEPSLAGPKRPQDRVALSDAATDFRAELEEYTGDNAPTGYDEAVAESFPASDPPTNNGGGQEPKVGPQPPDAGHRCGRARGGLRPRLGRDRRDHELHEHLEPVGDARRRPARQEGGRGAASSGSRG